MLQVVVTVQPTGQVQVGCTEPGVGIDRLIGILELGKLSIFEAAMKPPGQQIEVPNAETAKKLVG